MLIKTDLKSNQAALLRAKLATFVLLFLSIPFVIYLVSCSPKTQLEKLTNAAPPLYDSQTNQAIPSTHNCSFPPIKFRIMHFSQMRTSLRLSKCQQKNIG